MFAEVRPNFGRIVTCCRAELSRIFGRILRRLPNFGPSLITIRIRENYGYRYPQNIYPRIHIRASLVISMTTVSLWPTKKCICDVYTPVICTEVSTWVSTIVNFAHKGSTRSQQQQQHTHCGKSSEPVKCAMLKAYDACADMGQL